MELFDTHCHLTDAAFDGDLTAVLQRARDAGVKYVLSVAVDEETIEKSRQLSAISDQVLVALGIHPEFAHKYPAGLPVELRKKIKEGSTHAVGETGLDFFKWRDSAKAQEKLFEEHIQITLEIGKPLSVHCRDAHERCYEILRAHRPRFVMHCYSGDEALAKKFLDIGGYISFAGPVTFKNAHKTRAVAASIPLDRLLIETDSPVLAPQPHRGSRNEPAFLPLILRGMSQSFEAQHQRICEMVFENSVRLLL